MPSHSHWPRIYAFGVEAANRYWHSAMFAFMLSQFIGEWKFSEMVITFGRVKVLAVKHSVHLLNVYGSTLMQVNFTVSYIIVIVDVPMLICTCALVLCSVPISFGWTMKWTKTLVLRAQRWVDTLTACYPSNSILHVDGGRKWMESSLFCTAIATQLNICSVRSRLNTDIFTHWQFRPFLSWIAHYEVWSVFCDIFLIDMDVVQHSHSLAMFHCIGRRVTIQNLWVEPERRT